MPAKTKLVVQCSLCEGSGMMPLSSALVETLAVFKRRQPKTALEVHDALGLPGKPNKVNNRLELLVRQGFLTKGDRIGREFQYMRAPKSPTAKKMKG